MTNNSGQNLAQGALAAFQQFPGQSSQYAGTPQLTSPVTHLTSAVQVTPQVTSQVAPQVSSSQSPGSDYGVCPICCGPTRIHLAVFPQPQLVMTPQQSSVVVPQVVNTNITYTFTAPETLVINQPAMVFSWSSSEFAVTSTCSDLLHDIVHSLSSTTGPTTPLPSPEVKELRIKAKVSVGPKRKKAKSRDPEKDLIIVNKDTSSDLYVNEQLPNFSVNPMHNPADDPAMFDKPKACSAEPYIVFELTSEDGFRVESRHIAEVWQKVFDAVAAARASMRMDPKVPHNIQQPSSPGDSISGLHMLGLTHNAVQYLLEQLPGAKDCHKYSFQFHRRPQEEGAVEENPTGCARTEPFKTRSPYDIFSWLASKHRRMPERSLVQQEEIQLSTTRRATSLELPMAMGTDTCERLRVRLLGYSAQAFRPRPFLQA
ncbi:Histone-lysine N-methyltransferase trithorax [Penaeus vannamei]|uniref:Histone-lysine N-methyltransferase trithorax n=1 Tax=Penaeus vannamei TaxID=6689 RepID=A0A423SH16_PENVA|nr:Histone-lysine N-methyltransferase trithorax [Penaeus vannamei]